MASADEIEVQVAYAAIGRQAVKTLKLPAGSSVEQAIRASGLLEAFPEIDLTCQRVGRSRHPASATAPGVALPPASMQSSRDTSTSLYVGVFGEPVRLDERLNGGERVEIYRALIADPKEARRRRAKSKKRR